jgi:hypothetical protein
MCFLFYGGTTKPIPRIAWNQDARDISVQSLAEVEDGIRQHFSNPEVQYIGSTTGCGCGFSNVMWQNGGWPSWDDPDEIPDPSDDAEDRQNREGLVSLLRATGEDSVELYGVWSGNEQNPLHSREVIHVNDILDPAFLFKEYGFYTVNLRKPD